MTNISSGITENICSVELPTGKELATELRLEGGGGAAQAWVVVGCKVAETAHFCENFPNV